MDAELREHEELVAELRAALLGAPPRLRARVLAQERRPVRRLALAAVAAAAVVGAAIGGGVAGVTRGAASSPTAGEASMPPAKSTAPSPMATQAPQDQALPQPRATGWTWEEGALAGGAGGLVLGAAGWSLARLHRRPI